MLKLPKEKEPRPVPAIQSYFIEPIWEQFLALLPEREVDHPVGYHRPRVPDRIVLEKLVEMLGFGCAYWRFADEECSETSLRRRRDLSGLEPDNRHLEKPLTLIRKLLNMHTLR